MNRNEIEAFVVELRNRQGLNWSQVKHALTEEGVSEIEAREIVDRFREIEEEAESVIQEKQNEMKARAQLDEILKEDGAESPMDRANNKIAIGFVIFFAGIVLFFVLPPVSSTPRLAAVVCVVGLGKIWTGFKHRSVITKHKKKRK